MRPTLTAASATIVGAGVFGAWIARTLTDRGWAVTLLDQHGPGNSRSSSGGETRIIRSAYGSLAVYARWARQSLPGWIALERRVEEQLFVRTGALFIAREAAWLDETAATLKGEGILCEHLDGEALARRFPQLAFADAVGAVMEPDAGVLFARRAVQCLVSTLIEDGVTVRTERITAVADAGASTDVVIFACGAWLPSLFPEELGDAIAPTRQEVFFFGSPPGDARFSAAHLPAWVAFDEGIYGLPDLEHRGVKIAIDAHGVSVDPESMDRLVGDASLASIRDLLRRCVPELADAPLLETRVCQYENTTDGHFLLDRLPGNDRVWIAGGGSGHGFKHGPAIGKYVADLLEGSAGDPRFQLAGRPPRRRAVY